MARHILAVWSYFSAAPNSSAPPMARQIEDGFPDKAVSTQEVRPTILYLFRIDLPHIVAFLILTDCVERENASF
jgi:hypothetical protein